MLTHFVTNITLLSDPLVYHCNVRLEAGPEQKKNRIKNRILISTVITL